MNELLRRLLALPPQLSSFARELDYLHYSVILTTMLGATGVAGAAAYFVVRYRRRPGQPESSPDLRSAPLKLRVELGIVVSLLALFVLWWVIGFRQLVMLEIPPGDALPIYATAKQWMWTFIYPDGSTSNGVLLLPAGQPVKMILSSRDVIHSFYIPEFRVKKDVLPGQVTTVWFRADHPGKASLYCAEYCGTEHSLMSAEVQILQPAEYAERVKHLPPVPMPSRGETLSVQEPTEGLISLARVGQRVAVEHGCLRCHTTDGTPHLGPTWAGLLGSNVPLADGNSIVADEAYITESMMDPRVKLHDGFAPIMPSYQGLIDAPETGAIIEYIRSLPAAGPGSPRAPLAPPDAPAVRLPGSAGSAASSSNNQ